jgi:hypothetical protein
MNRKGLKPEQQTLNGELEDIKTISSDILHNNSLTRFDVPENRNSHFKHQKRKKNRRFNGKNNQ